MIEHEAVDQELYHRVLESAYDLGMFQVDFEDPFELTGGKESPLYIDARRFIQDPAVANDYISSMEAVIGEAGIDYDLLGGGATAGMIYSERLAQERGEPSIYIRGEPKGHGRAAQIEGMESLDGKTVLLVEDLITNGGSKHDFIDGIERAGGTVNDCLSFYDREQGGQESLQERGVDLWPVVPLTVLMEHGYRTCRLDRGTYSRLEAYLDGRRTEQFQKA